MVVLGYRTVLIFMIVMSFLKKKEKQEEKKERQKEKKQRERKRKKRITLKLMTVMAVFKDREIA